MTNHQRPMENLFQWVFFQIGYKVSRDAPEYEKDIEELKIVMKWLNRYVEESRHD